MRPKFTNLLILVFILISVVWAKEKPKKRLEDYTDSDFEKLYEEWEEGDEDPLEPDERPDYLMREPPLPDFSKIDMNNPEEMLKLTKMGKPLMVIVGVSGNPSKHESEKITELWQSSLSNAGWDVKRFMIEDAKAIFMFQDGSKAWDGKDYLIKQDRCSDVTIEGRTYAGKDADKDALKAAKDSDPKNKKSEL